MSNCVTVPNFVALGQTVAEISRFLIFQDGGRRHLGFLKCQIFISMTRLECRTASLSQISLRSVKQTVTEISRFLDL